MIDHAKYDRMMSVLKKLRPKNTLKRILNSGEDAWKANREAIRLIDLKNDEIYGEEKLFELEDALRLWIEELEGLSDAAKKIARRASQAVHSGGSTSEPEEDGEGKQHPEAGPERASSNYGRTESRKSDGGRSRRVDSGHRNHRKISRSRRKAADKTTNRHTIHS